MTKAVVALKEDYWQTFQLNEKDGNFIFSILLEKEIPLSINDLMVAVIHERIRQEKQNLQNMQNSQGNIYHPKDKFVAGQNLVFPAQGWKKGEVVSIRKGNNPELETFDVITVLLEDVQKKDFASGILNHKLNQPIELHLDDPQFNPQTVIDRFGEKICIELEHKLKSDKNYAFFANTWFPKSLMIDINIGHLNLAEAILDMEGGGPLPAKKLLEQLDLPSDVNSPLKEFSLNYSMGHDERFDEVGPAGEVLWFLRRLEPEFVQNNPPYLQFDTNLEGNQFKSYIQELNDSRLIDEIEPTGLQTDASPKEITLSLIYPHWRSGTLPLTSETEHFFPTAYEAPRIRVAFLDGDTGKTFWGWVVRPGKYIYGLREWYLAQGLIPGSLIHIKKGKNKGEVILQVEKKRQSREWIRTVLVGADGGIVLAMLKQIVTASFHDRMVLATGDINAIDGLWKSGQYLRKPIGSLVQFILKELAKLNPQGHVHAEEIYACVNLLKRCPPSLVVQTLFNATWCKHLGNMYFKLNDEHEQELNT